MTSVRGHSRKATTVGTEAVLAGRTSVMAPRAPEGMSTGTKASVTGLLLLLAVVAAMALSTASASANVNGLFCPSGGGTIGIAAYPGRCVGVFHTTYGQVEANNELTSVNKCAVVKPNSDGSGGDVGAPAACAPGLESAFVSFGQPGVQGYAVMINNSTNFHTGFHGDIILYT